MPTAEAKRERVPMNGVDTPALFATINAVKGQPELGDFKFRATSKWLKGTHSRSKAEAFTGAGGTYEQAGDFQIDADHPPVLCGQGKAPTPVELMLHGLAGCLTAGIANIAAARGVQLTSVESSVEGVGQVTLPPGASQTHGARAGWRTLQLRGHPGKTVRGPQGVGVSSPRSTVRPRWRPVRATSS